MGVKITDIPDKPEGMRLELWEDDFLLMTIDLDERLPMQHWGQAERIILHEYGNWIFDPKSRYHKQWERMGEGIKVLLEEMKVRAR